MTVKELIELLQQEDPDRLVILSEDPEGNSFSPLDDVVTGAYVEDTWGNGEFGLEKLTKQDRDAGYGESDIVDGARALCLWPAS